jgi:hypothetical protein
MLCSATALAQSEAAVRGQVVAATDGSALVQAIVVLTSEPAGTSRQASTDTAGRFAFQNVPPGAYVLAGSSAGFATRELRLAIQPREVRNIVVALDLDRVQVSLQVTAETSLVSGTHSPSATLLTPERLQAMPIGERLSLPDTVVTAAPGMIRGHDDFVHIRGHEVALNPLINGVSFWENPHGLFSAGLSPMVIQSANVMTGGFSAEYGNRFGGVVDIVTKSGLQMSNEGSATASAGQAGRRTAAADFGGHQGGLAYYIFGAASSSDRVLSPPDREAIHDSGRSGHVFAQLDRDLGGGNLLRAGGGFRTRGTKPARSLACSHQPHPWSRSAAEQPPSSAPGVADRCRKRRRHRVPDRPGQRVLARTVLDTAAGHPHRQGPLLKRPER